MPESHKFDGHSNPIRFVNLANASFQEQNASYQGALMLWASGRLFTSTGVAANHNKIRKQKPEHAHLYKFPPSLTADQARTLLEEHYDLLCSVYVRFNDTNMDLGVKRSLLNTLVLEAKIFSCGLVPADFHDTDGLLSRIQVTANDLPDYRDSSTGEVSWASHLPARP